MGKQVSLLLLPADLRGLESKLRLGDAFTVIHSRSPSSGVRCLNSLDPETSGVDWLHLFLARTQDLESVATIEVEAQAYWAVDVLRSPVVEFQRCYFDGITLRRGRAYYVDKYFDAQGRVVEKSEEFRRWANWTFRTIRGALSRRGPDYVGVDADRWLTSLGGRVAAS